MTAHELVDRLLNEAESPKRFFQARKAMTSRVPGPNEVQYELLAEPEDEAPDFEDPQDLAFVREQIRMGNVWGWCRTEVIAKWTDSEGNEYEGHDYLGGCSYRSRRDFMEPGGYYDDMKSEAYDELVKQLVKAGFKEI